MIWQHEGDQRFIIEGQKHFFPIKFVYILVHYLNLPFSTSYYVSVLHLRHLNSCLSLSTGTSGDPDGDLGVKSWCPPWATRFAQPSQPLTSMLHGHLGKWLIKHFLPFWGVVFFSAQEEWQPAMLVALSGCTLGRPQKCFMRGPGRGHWKSWGGHRIRFTFAHHPPWFGNIF